MPEYLCYRYVYLLTPIHRPALLYPAPFSVKASNVSLLFCSRPFLCASSNMCLGLKRRFVFREPYLDSFRIPFLRNMYIFPCLTAQGSFASFFLPYFIMCAASLLCPGCCYCNDGSSPRSSSIPSTAV